MSRPETEKTADALPASKAAARRPTPQLRVVFGPDLNAGAEPATAPLASDLLVGRSHRCDLMLADPRVSGRHARINRGRLSDAGSRHGTFVNGRRLPPGDEVNLSAGDVVRMGDSLIVVTPDRPRPPGGTHQLTGVSPHLAAIDRRLARVSSPLARVLVVGPPGVGKERVANALADRVAALRGRARVPMVAFNAAAVAEDLQEAELFGVHRGAFTGATARDGLFAQARGGVLFLDEIGEAKPGLQATLLRVVQRDGTFRKVGGARAERVDAALVFATNRDLEAEVERGRFRADLSSRIRDERFALPGVAERREDILALVASGLPDGGQRFDVTLAERLLLAPHPGNVRDLLALATRIAAYHREVGRLLDVADAGELGLRPPFPAAVPASRPSSGKAYRDPERFAAAWDRHNGSVRAVARELGCDEKTVRVWRKKHGE